MVGFFQLKGRLNPGFLLHGGCSMNLQLPGQGVVPIEVVQTKRQKTVSINVVDGNLRILVPKVLSADQIQEFINAKSVWIARKLHDFQVRRAIESKKYIDGDVFLYLGREYRLRCVEKNDCEPVVKLRAGLLYSVIGPCLDDDARRNQHRDQIYQWYREKADLYLKKRTHLYSRIMSCIPMTIRVRYYKARWGACSASGDINYDWRIVIAPTRIVDYLVIHELSHLRYRGHGPKFWRYVAEYADDYRERRSWLRDNGHTLVM
jgi:predicted metal-dependent hydrolase